MLQKFRLPLIFILLISAIIGGKLLLGGEEKNAGPQAKNQHPAEVDGIIVRTEPLSGSLSLTGTLIPNERTDLYAEISGKITTILVQEGKAVREGDILIKLYDADIRAQLRKTEAQLAEARSREVRLKKLLAVQGVSREEYESAYYQIQALEADSDLIATQLGKTLIRAPFSGTVGLRYVSPGAMAGPGVRLLSLQKTYPLKLDFTLPEGYARSVQAGKSIPFSVQGSKQTYTARVLATEGLIEEGTRSLKVRALCAESSSDLLPGSFARIQYPSAETDSAMLLPAISIIPVLKGQKVLVSRQGQVEEVRVETGIRKEARVQIVNGLQPGDTVLTSGIMALKPGDAVQVRVSAAKGN